ncbi:MAG: hypothetical protein ACKON7_05335, partial [Planctomycetaceae bacterium]
MADLDDGGTRGKSYARPASGATGGRGLTSGTTLPSGATRPPPPGRHPPERRLFAAVQVPGGFARWMVLGWVRE